MAVRYASTRFEAAMTQNISEYNARKERENRLARRRALLSRAYRYLLLAGFIGVTAGFFYCDGISMLSVKVDVFKKGSAGRSYTSTSSVASHQQGVRLSGNNHNPLSKTPDL